MGCGSSRRVQAITSTPIHNSTIHSKDMVLPGAWMSQTKKAVPISANASAQTDACSRMSDTDVQTDIELTPIMGWDTRDVETQTPVDEGFDSLDRILAKADQFLMIPSKYRSDPFATDFVDASVQTTYSRAEESTQTDPIPLSEVDDPDVKENGSFDSIFTDISNKNNNEDKDIDSFLNSTKMLSMESQTEPVNKGRIIGKLEEGRSVTSVAAEFGIAHSIVSRLWRQFQTTGTAIRGFSSGRPRATTPADDRYIVLQARRNRRQTAREIARHRRLDDRYRVLPWPEDCTVVVCLNNALYDESRFSLSSDSHRILIWRERGSRNHHSNIIERDRYGGRGVLVWGGIMLGSRTDLHIFDAEALWVCSSFLDDNAPCHRTVAAEQLLESEDIERMDWPARSPDLNPIEHVWDFLGRRLAARTLPPVTIQELRLALQDEWAAMPQQLIDTLILSMGRRCETCLAVRGDHIPY
ncbi:transposable element Tcb2 transposase [Trichonephila clavipes]|nr:transposable element Tcb2 transposase [Trichonephila clavipes]